MASVPDGGYGFGPLRLGSPVRRSEFGDPVRNRRENLTAADACPVLTVGTGPDAGPIEPAAPDRWSRGP